MLATHPTLDEIEVRDCVECGSEMAAFVTASSNSCRACVISEARESILAQGREEAELQRKNYKPSAQEIMERTERLEEWSYENYLGNNAPGFRRRLSDFVDNEIEITIEKRN